jgi:acyl dehydratase
MAKVTYYEDVEVGAEVPPLVKHPTTRQLVKWAGASGDLYEIHYDKDFAQSQGLPGVIVHGWLTASFLAQLVTDWMGEEATLKKFGCSYRGMHVPGEDILIKGKVAKKYEAEGQPCVELELWAENTKGERTVPGTATVYLPSRRAG